MSQVSPVTSEYDWHRLERQFHDDAEHLRRIIDNPQDINSGLNTPTKRPSLTNHLWRLEEHLNILQAKTDRIDQQLNSVDTKTNTIGKYLAAQETHRSEIDPGHPVEQERINDLATDNELDGNWTPEHPPEIGP